MSKLNKQKIEIIYDSECPMCDHFASAISDSDKATTIDGRKPSETHDRAKGLGLDIDHGSIVYVDGKYLYGPEAVTYIANHIPVKGLVGLVNRILFRHYLIAKITYPVFVWLRHLLLKRSNTPFINQPEPQQSVIPIEVYYNGACPVCKAGVDYQTKRMLDCNVIWNDIHRDPTKSNGLNSNIEFIRERLHLLDNQGQLKIGIDAFITLWAASPKEHWKATLFSLPLAHGIARMGYNAFAKILYNINRRLKTDSRGVSHAK